MTLFKIFTRFPPWTLAPDPNQGELDLIPREFDDDGAVPCSYCNDMHYSVTEARACRSTMDMLQER